MAVERHPRPRPARSEVEPAALALIERHGAHVLATARRYSGSLEDAEDAYQRGLEILLLKAPTTREEELLPWLKTVVKHEAFAIRRQRERASPSTSDGEPAEPPGAEAATHDEAERRDRLRVGAEAMRRLKPQELRCLVLKAEGYSYREICAITGFTYTNVNRPVRPVGLAPERGRGGRSRSACRPSGSRPPPTVWTRPGGYLARAPSVRSPTWPSRRSS